MYRILFFFFMFIAFSCSDSQDCLSCSAVTTSDESIRCGISNQFDQISVLELGEICDQAEFDALKAQHEMTEFPIYSNECAGEPYTRTTRLVCN